MDSRSAVWALRMIASPKFCTSSRHFSAFQTTQKTIASTLTGTVSRVNADSALTSETRTRWSTDRVIVSMSGMTWKEPGPFSPRYLPRRRTAIFSHCFATFIENRKYAPTMALANSGAGWPKRSVMRIPAITLAAQSATLIGLDDLPLRLYAPYPCERYVHHLSSFCPDRGTSQ